MAYKGAVDLPTLAPLTSAPTALPSCPLPEPHWPTPGPRGVQGMGSPLPVVRGARHLQLRLPCPLRPTLITEVNVAPTQAQSPSPPHPVPTVVLHAS